MSRKCDILAISDLDEQDSDEDMDARPQAAWTEKRRRIVNVDDIVRSDDLERVMA